MARQMTAVGEFLATIQTGVWPGDFRRLSTLQSMKGGHNDISSCISPIHDNIVHNPGPIAISVKGHGRGHNNANWRVGRGPELVLHSIEGETVTVSSDFHAALRQQIGGLQNTDRCAK